MAATAVANRPTTRTRGYTPGTVIDNMITVLAGPPVVIRGRNAIPEYDALYAAVSKVPRGTWTQYNTEVEADRIDKVVAGIQSRASKDNLRLRSSREIQQNGNYMLSLCLLQK